MFRFLIKDTDCGINMGSLPTVSVWLNYLKWIIVMKWAPLLRKTFSTKHVPNREMFPHVHQTLRKRKFLTIPMQDTGRKRLN
ncbi:hypothetical protein CEXT_109001 [Caerostris extrusa]|uniref:Uncharacterized protein n=1 Tax=Caerostris extrusa TaxID=172846 RepID=A0AAV4VHS2_CAEEX|nr:hypothetical protein CEXT_109001 [Caerostris extrusa]